jgi:peroxiredoxin
MALFHGKKLRTLLLASFFCLGFSGTSQALEVGTKAPDFQLSGDKGLVRLSNNSGSVVYVDFWASWCGPCKQSFGWMNAMQEKYGAQGLKVIGVNLDAKTEDAKKFLAQSPANFTVVYDAKGDVPKAFGVKGMPTSFLVSKSGKIIFQHLGFKEADRDNLEQQIKAALEAKK